MKFDKEHKVIVQTMNREQAAAFTKFLDSEILRHQMDIDHARALKDYVIDEFALTGLE